MGGIVESSAKLFALGRYLLVHIVESLAKVLARGRGGGERSCRCDQITVGENRGKALARLTKAFLVAIVTITTTITITSLSL